MSSSASRGTLGGGPGLGGRRRDRRRDLDRLRGGRRPGVLHGRLLRRARHQVPAGRGAALYVHRAWRTPFFTFLVAFAVVCSGVTSAAALATAFGGDYLKEFVDLPQVLVGIVFIGVIALVNFRGIKESVTLNMA
jgi:hypothetical protein